MKTTFKVGDRVAVYCSRSISSNISAIPQCYVCRCVFVVKEVKGDKVYVGDKHILYHKKQCRRLVKKESPVLNSKTSTEVTMTMYLELVEKIRDYERLSKRVEFIERDLFMVGEHLYKKFKEDGK